MKREKQEGFLCRKGRISLIFGGLVHPNHGRSVALVLYSQAMGIHCFPSLNCRPRWAAGKKKLKRARKGVLERGGRACERSTCWGCLCMNSKLPGLTFIEKIDLTLYPPNTCWETLTPLQRLDLHWLCITPYKGGHWCKRLKNAVK